MKDTTLMLGVAFLVGIDLIILITYCIVEGVKNELVAKRVSHKERPVTLTMEGVSGVKI